jgi:hypothetical protein
MDFGVEIRNDSYVGAKLLLSVCIMIASSEEGLQTG